MCVASYVKRKYRSAQQQQLLPVARIDNLQTATAASNEKRPRLNVPIPDRMATIA